MPKYLATNGDDFVVRKLDRSYKGVETDAIKVDGSTGVVALGTTTATSLTVGGKTPATGTFFSVVSLGANASVTATYVTISGLKIGDKLIAAANLTTPGDAQTAFEATVTVAGQLQQATTDLSAKQIMFVFNRP